MESNGSVEINLNYRKTKSGGSSRSLNEEEVVTVLTRYTARESSVVN